MPAGRIWWKSKSASCAANASTAASTTRKRSSPRSPLGNSGATPKALRSSGCSLPRRLAKNSAKPTPSRSHNLGGAVLVEPAFVTQADHFLDEDRFLFIVEACE